MNETIQRFLQFGRHFRGHYSKGSVLLIESDPIMRMFIKRWAETIGAEVVECSIVEAAREYFGNRVRCVILGLDGQDVDQSHGLLFDIDRNHPATVSIVYSSNRELIMNLQIELPRVTAVSKGEGLEEFIFSLDAEVRMEGISA